MEKDEEVKEEEVSNDGVIRSIVLLVGKKGDTYSIASFFTPAQFRDRAIKTFEEASGVFVFPIEIEGQYNDVIIPAREVYSLTIKKFSQLEQVKPIQEVNPNGIQRHRR